MRIMFSRVILGVGLEPVVVVDDLPEETNMVRMYHNLVAAFHDDEPLKTVCIPNPGQFEVLEIRI